MKVKHRDLPNKIIVISQNAERNKENKYKPEHI